MTDLDAEFLVSCLCAQWCGSCRTFQPDFEALVARNRHSNVAYVWVDVEDDSELAGDVDVDNFPTFVIQRGTHVLFCGPIVPDTRALERLLESFRGQTFEASAAYAGGNPERCAWQGLADVRSRLKTASMSKL